MKTYLSIFIEMHRDTFVILKHNFWFKSIWTTLNIYQVVKNTPATASMHLRKVSMFFSQLDSFS